jgi:2-oxoisovalerate dehydrogenase E2 component (dihydrolipoyl transacylase)
MATYVFKLPDVGEGVAEAEIIQWHVKVGDSVKEDQPLVDVMTDKATVEITSPIAGTVLSRGGEPGMKAAVGAELVTFDTAAKGEAATPAAIAPAEARAKPAKPPPPKPAAGGNILAAPAVRARATTLGIGLETVEGTGPEGRIVHRDLDRLLQMRQGTARPAVEVQKGSEEIAVFGLRRKIAERMQDSKRRIPHFTYVEEVDVTALEDLRKELNESPSRQRPRLTVLPFLIRALVKSIAAHPGVNAHFDDGAGVIHRHAAVHAGIATQTPRGLLVPVVHHAERLGLWQLGAEIARLSEAARVGKSRREELSGSTITVTSLGALGGIAATPIINAPEVAIVGVNRIAARPVVRDGQIVIRKMMNLSSSFDHRIVDGHDAAAFIQSVKQALETPATLTGL